MATSSTRPRLLVVDDSELFRAVVGEMLDVAGCEVAATASTAEEALALLAGGLVVDLVLMDIQLPGMSGPEATARISARGGRPPVLLMSSLDPRDVAAWVESSGAAGFVPKSALDGDAVWGALVGGAGTTADGVGSP